MIYFALFHPCIPDNNQVSNNLHFLIFCNLISLVFKISARTFAAIYYVHVRCLLHTHTHMHAHLDLARFRRNAKSHICMHLDSSDFMVNFF